MDKGAILCLWLVGCVLLVVGVILLHVLRHVPLGLRVKGLGIEVEIRSGSDDTRRGDSDGVPLNPNIE